MYGFARTVKGCFDDVLTRTKEALAAEGFGVLTSIDVQATLKAKLGVDGRPYTILGACNPPLAHQALSADPDIGLLLPCNVVVREESDGAISVAFMDPLSVLGMVKAPGVDEIAGQVRTKLDRVATNLTEEAAA